MDQDKLSNLLERYLADTIDKVELRQLLDLLEVNDSEALDLIVDKLAETGIQPGTAVGRFDSDAVLRRIRRRIDKHLLAEYWLAASVIGLLIFLFVVLYQRNSRLPSVHSISTFSDILLPEQGQVAVLRRPKNCIRNSPKYLVIDSTSKKGVYIS